MGDVWEGDNQRERGREEGRERNKRETATRETEVTRKEQCVCRERERREGG